MKHFVIGILIAFVLMLELTACTQTAKAEMNSVAMEIFIDSNLAVGVGLKAVVDDHLEVHVTKTNQVRIGAGYYDTKHCGDAYFGYSLGLAINMTCLNPEGYIRVLAGYEAGDVLVEMGAINYGGAKENTFATFSLGVSLYDELDRHLGVDTKPTPKKEIPENLGKPEDPGKPDKPNKPGHGYGDDNHDHDGPPGQNKDKGDKPGWGHGDKNHDHYGPPGQNKK